MGLRTVIATSRATGVGLGALGFFWGGFAALMPDWQARAGVSDGVLGLLLLLSAVGGMSGMAAGPRVQSGLGRVALPVLTLQLGLVGMVAWAIGSPLALGLVLLWLGWSMSGLDIASNVEISHREAQAGLSLMNWNHALFSFCFAASAGLSGVARRAGAEPGWIMALVGAIVICAALATYEPPAQPREGSEPGAARAKTPWLVVIPAGAMLFFAFVAENSTESWSALHIERNFDAAAGEGAFGPMMLGLTMGMGRLLGQIVAARLGERRLIVLSACIGAFGALLTALAPIKLLAILGIALIGIGAAVVVPSTNSLLGRRVKPRARPLALSRAWLIGFTGFFIGPVAMGAIAEGVGLRWAFGVVAVIMAAIVPGLLRLLKAPQE